MAEKEKEVGRKKEDEIVRQDAMMRFLRSFLHGQVYACFLSFWATI